MKMVGDRYTFTSGREYEITVARSLEDRRRAWALVHDVYSKQGYAPRRPGGLWCGPHDALPGTTTLLTERDGEAVATLTLLFDSPLGLPSDDLYAEELQDLRDHGRYLCEIVSLANTERCRTANALIVKHLFKLAFLATRHVEHATDFVITVNPHHVPYYRRLLLFDQVGSERTYDKVCGAPAVLLRLDLLDAPRRYWDQYHGRRGERDLHRFFCIEEVRRLCAWLKLQRDLLEREMEEDCEIRHFIRETGGTCGVVPVGPSAERGCDAWRIRRRLRPRACSAVEKLLENIRERGAGVDLLDAVPQPARGIRE